MIGWLKTKWRARTAHDALGSLVNAIWFADSKYVEGLFERMRLEYPTVTNADIRDARKRSEERSRQAPELVIERGVARIPIVGPIMREVPCIFELFDIAATSTTTLQQLIRDARASDEVKSIFLSVDSPGGTLDGTSVAADDIFAARSSKPVHAHATGMAASAGYWLPVQADKFTAEATTIIGSIGVYSVVQDLSAHAAQLGVKVHVIRSGPHKGAGVPGSEVTPAMLAVEQEIIDRAREMFVDAIARGRGARMSRERIDELATGRVWLGADAVPLGLIDGIETIEAALDAAASTSRARADFNVPILALDDDEGDDDMPPTTTAPAANTPAAPAVNTEAEQLRAELAEERKKNADLKAAVTKAEAERDLAKNALDDYRWSALTDVIDMHAKAGRVAPADRAEVDRIARAAYLGEKDGPKKLDAELAKRRQATKPKTAVAPEDMPEEPSVEAEEKRADAAIRAEVARQMGVTIERVEAAANVVALRSDGKPIDAQGNLVELPVTPAATAPQPSA